MTTVEVRDHLGPNEIEIDGPLYAIMLVNANGTAILNLKVYHSKEAALIDIDKYYGQSGYVVKIAGTNA